MSDKRVMAIIEIGCIMFMISALLGANVNYESNLLGWVIATVFGVMLILGMKDRSEST